jgi:predicted dehydrogenase
LKIVKVGVIGCGIISEFGHLPAYMRVPGVKVQAIADINNNLLRRVSKKFRIERCYLDYEDLLQKEKDIDAVSICLPTFLHKDAVIASAQAGKHVLCEKPLALNTEEGNQMIRTAEKQGVKLYVGYCLRFSKVIESLRQWIHSGSLRNPLTVKIVNTFPKKVDGKSWYFDISKGGGALFDLGAHPADLLIWMFGHTRVTSTRFKESIEIPGLDIESVVNMIFDDGLEGQLYVSWKDNPAQQLVEVKCAEGNLCADLIKSTLRIQSPRSILGKFTNGVEILVDQTLPYLHEEIWFFVNSILDDKNNSEKLLATGEDGIRSLEIITSAYKKMHEISDR